MNRRLDENPMRIWEIILWLMLAVIIMVAVGGMTTVIRSPLYEKFERWTGYKPEKLYKVYAYDASQWQDSNALYIFSMKDERFEAYVKLNWTLLPFSGDMHGHFLLEPDFDSKMADMLTGAQGYWTTGDEDGHWVCVYHSDEKLLYIRAWAI